MQKINNHKDYIPESKLKLLKVDLKLKKKKNIYLTSEMNQLYQNYSVLKPKGVSKDYKYSVLQFNKSVAQV